jgi:uncharacterized protein (DUF362 family)
MGKSKVYLVSADDRGYGARRCLEYTGLSDYTRKTVLVKPNFNTADPPPGSTHNDTLEALLCAVREKNPKKIILGERSGPANADEVFKIKGLAEMCDKYGAEFVNFENLPPEEWVDIDKPGLHWPAGTLKIPRMLAEADAVVATCCLKTHGFGGVFSNTLKLAVGITPKDFATLHNTPDMRRMIAEINLAYTPELIIVDAVEVFTDGGPMDGERKRADLMLAGSDRVALDAVGLAILKSLGSNSAIMDTPIFSQEQIARAVELELGVSRAEDIVIVTDDEASAAVATRIQDILLKA